MASDLCIHNSNFELYFFYETAGTPGSMQYSNVSEGAHILRIVAKSEDKNVTRVVRRFYVGELKVFLFCIILITCCFISMLTGFSLL